MKTIRNRAMASLGKLLAAIALFGLATGAQAQTVDEIVAASIKAIGGSDAIAKITSIARKATVEAGGDFGDFGGTMEQMIIPGKKSYQSMDLGVIVQVSGWNGTVAWSDDGLAGLRELPEDEALTIISTASIHPLIDYKANGATLAKLEDESVDDEAHFVLELTPKAGPKVQLYISKATSLLTFVITTLNNPDLGEMEVQIENMEYGEFEGVKLPIKTLMSLGDLFEMEMTFTETIINGEVDDSIFDKPGA